MRRGSISHDLSNGNAGQKGWSSERVALPTSSGHRHVKGNASLMTLSSYGGRTVPSKWEDAERWICSPVGGEAKNSQSLGQQRRPKSKSGPIVPPEAEYYSNYSPSNLAFDGGSLRNFAVGLPFSTGVLGADSVSLLCGGSGGMGRSTSLIRVSELQDEKLDDTKCEEQSISRGVSQRDMGTQISTPKRCLHSPPPKRRSSFAPSSPTLISIVEQHKDHFAKLEVREVQVDNGATGIKGCRRRGSVTKGPPEANDFDKIGVDGQASSIRISEAAMDISKLQREEANITAWENLQKAKAEAALRKLEMKLEKKRSSTMDKIMKKLRKAQVKAHQMRDSVPVKDSNQVPKTFRRHARIMGFCSCFKCV